MTIDTDIKYHNAHISFNVLIPDGVYVPEQFQFSEEAMKMVYRDNPVHGDSIMLSVEVHDYLLSILDGMGIILRSSGVGDAYKVLQ